MCGCSRTSSTEIAEIPGVTSAAFATRAADGDGLREQHGRDRRGTRRTAEGIPPMRRSKYVAPGFFKTLGIPLIAGRDFTWTDVDESPPGRHRVEQHGTRGVGPAVRGTRQTDSHRARRAVERDHRRRWRCLRQRRRSATARDRVLARRRTRRLRAGSHLHPARPVVRDPQRSGRHRGLDQAGGPRRLGGRLRICLSPACRRSARSTRQSMARTSFTLVMLAIAGRHGAGAWPCRHLRRDLVRVAPSSVGRSAFAWRWAPREPRSSASSSRRAFE